MRRMLIAVAALVLAIAFAPVGAKADHITATLGCGGGNGASVACNGQNLGTVTQNSGTVSGSADVYITSISGLPSDLQGLPIFTPQTDEFDLSFTGAGSNYAAGGTFSFTDLTEAGLLTVTGGAEYTGSIPSGLVGTLDLNLSANSYSFNGSGGSFDPIPTGVSLVLDPGNVMSMTGSVGLPNGGPTPTPEPGTLLLFSSGLMGIGYLRRKVGRG